MKIIGVIFVSFVTMAVASAHEGYGGLGTIDGAGLPGDVAGVNLNGVVHRASFSGTAQNFSSVLAWGTGGHGAFADGGDAGAVLGTMKKGDVYEFIFESLGVHGFVDHQDTFFVQRGGDAVMHAPGMQGTYVITSGASFAGLTGSEVPEPGGWLLGLCTVSYLVLIERNRK